MPGHDDFWDNLIKGSGSDYSGGGTGSIDYHLSGTPVEGDQFTSVRELTDKGRAKSALGLPVEAGTRVSFAANLGAVMAYQDCPEPKAQGTVVTVKSAGGPITEHLGKVFVAWDDGKTRPIHAEHLRLVKAVQKKKGTPRGIMRVACLGDLTEFLKVSDTTLIHRSTKDLWSFRRDGTDFVIERLFDDTGDPIQG